jgi:outer membrane protein insertion porin family
MQKVPITLMMLAVCGFAQTRAPHKKQASAPAARWPIESLTVEGNRIYTRDQVLAATGLKIGQMAGRPEFEAARDRLVATGAFESVGYKFAPAANGGYSAVFQVAEVQQVYPAKFEGLHVSLKDLEAAFRAKEPLFSAGSLPATQPVLERYSKWLQSYLASKGETEKIAAMVVPDTPGDYAIEFRPARDLPAVAQITFEGNQVVPENVLREAISGVAIGSQYTEDMFRQMLNASVRPVYEKRGRLRVAFPKIRTEPAKDVQGVHVFVKVDEGQSYELGKVAIEGSSPVDTKELLKAGDFKTGDLANMDRVAQGVVKMRDAVRRAGYLNAEVTSDRHVDDDRKVVDVTVYVTAGPRYTMGKLNIVGLDLEGEAEMRRIWTLKTGAPYVPTYPDTFLKQVRERGMFDDLGETKADVKLNPDRTADVTLVFNATKRVTKKRSLPELP